MTVFLTSNPFLPTKRGFNPENGFVSRLLSEVKNPARVLIVAADPQSFDGNDQILKIDQRCMEDIGLTISAFHVLDNRTAEQAEALVSDSDVIILCGGHVPTQNDFFQRIQLKKHLEKYDGVIIGISAGSMNSAAMCYAQPELEGESVDPSYRRFLFGLGLTNKQILPHYNTEKDAVLDGKRLYEEITFLDSFGREFYVFPDGTYLYSKDGREEVCGEAYIFSNGEMHVYEHSKKRKNLGKQTAFLPLPVTIIGTYDENGVPNAMNAAWSGITDYHQVYVSMATHKTTENLEKTKAFTLSFATKDTAKIADYLGLVSGRTVDKISRCGLHSTKSEFVNAPVFEEFPLTLECNVHSFEDGILLGDIVNVSADESILDANGDIDIERAQPIVFEMFHNTYRSLGGVVGKAFEDGKKWMEEE